jgi:hypothetical protein
MIMHHWAGAYGALTDERQASQPIRSTLPPSAIAQHLFPHRTRSMLTKEECGLLLEVLTAERTAA